MTRVVEQLGTGAPDTSVRSGARVAKITITISPGSRSVSGWPWPICFLSGEPSA